MELQQTIKTLVESWKEAENISRSEIARNAPNSYEEDITRDLHRNLHDVFESKNEANEFEQSLANDLYNQISSGMNSYQDRDDEVFDSISAFSQGFCGTVNTITLHDRSTEGKTGADIGIVVSIPEINYGMIYNQNIFSVTDFNHNGLLVQAKIKNNKGKNAQWGTLTDKQISLLTENPEKLSYYSLLLYEYEDDERRNLTPFQWFDCKNETLKSVKNHLTKDLFFDKTMLTGKVIENLALGNLGTSDENIINNEIAKIGNVTLFIELSWRDGKPPPDLEVSIYSASKLESKEENYLYE